jgi:hypothetical protein
MYVRGGNRYGTGGGSDLAPSKTPFPQAPGPVPYHRRRRFPVHAIANLSEPDNSPLQFWEKTIPESDTRRAPSAIGPILNGVISAFRISALMARRLVTQSKSGHETLGRWYSAANGSEHESE